jgi:tetratricopeptide (TPR) repeat protein
MSIRPKTKRRVVTLALVATLVVCAGIALYRYRMYQANQKIDEIKTEGMAAFKAGDYPDAIDKLSVYVTKRKTDTEALMAFAIARSKVPTLDNSNIVQAVAIARRYCDLQPGDIEAQHFLLELEAPISLYAAAALDQAHDLLKGDPNDLTALKAIAHIQYRDRQFDEALDAAQKYSDADPTDLEMQQLVLVLMQKMERDPSEILARAADLQKKYPNDPRFLLVQAMAYICAQGPADTTEERDNQMQNAGKLLIQASQQDPPDPQFVSIATHMLDGTGHYTESLALLTRAAAKLKDPSLIPPLAQRLWQNHQFDQVIALLPDINPTSAASDKTSADLTAFKAMSLYQLNKKPDADALVAALASRTNEPAAASWTLVLQTEYGDPDLPLKTRLDNLQAALSHEPNNPVICYLLGETYLKMGESSLALEQWRAASTRSPSWAEPQVRIAEMLASEGHVNTDAFIAAERAKLAGTKGANAYQVQVVTAQILVAYSDWQTTRDPDRAKQLLNAVQALQTQIPNEPETLAVYVDMLAQTGDRDKAVSVIRAAETDAAQLHEDVLLRLAKVSRDDQLKMESEIYATIEKQFGMTPRLALAEATDLYNSGQAAQGMQLLQSSRDKGVGTPIQWDLEICQYREISGDPTAAASWAQLGDAHPDDLLVQSTILADEDSVWKNRPFIDRTITRLKDMTGDDAIGWKVYRARWLIDGDDSKADASAAIDLLSDVLKLSPSDVGPHILMAVANEKLQNYSAAITEWRQAADLAPQNPRVLWGLLSCLDADSQPDEARLAFDRLAAVPNLNPDLALEASLLIAREGDMQRAQQLLTAYPTCTNQVLHDSTLAKVDRLLGQINDAATCYFKLADAPNLDAGTIAEAADFFASQHDLAAARKFLVRLDELSIPTWQKEIIRADFEDRYGDLATSESFYAQAVKDAGDQPDAAMAQIGFLIRRREYDKATVALNLAIAQWQTNTDLTVLKNLNQTLSASPRIAQEAPDLVANITRDPSNPAGPDTLAAYASSQKPADVADAMSNLVQKYPKFFPAYQLAVQAMLAAGRMDDAVTLAGTAMVQFPASPDAARLSAQAYAAVGRWGDCILAANKWRQRGAPNPQQVDVMIAVADLYTDQAQDAVQRLAPYIPDAKDAPDANQDVIVTYAEALIRSGDESDAAALLHPLAEKSPQWRFNWLKVAAVSHTDGAAAIAWIDQIRPLFDSTSISDQEKIAEAYFGVAITLNYPKGFQLARDLLAPLVDSPQATVPLLMTYALACGSLNDAPDAEHAYRQLLKIDPNQPVAQNNLADLLRREDSPDALTEAESLARAAIAQQPNNPNTANFYDTLARALLKEGKTDDAIAAFQQGEQLQPRNFSILIGLASTYAHANRMDDAAKMLNQIDSLLPTNQQLPPDSQTELDATRDLVKKAAASSTNQ